MLMRVSIMRLRPMSFLFFFHDPAPTEIYTLSLHDALPILELATAAWVQWWNESRLHSAIGYIPPAEFEGRYYRLQEATEDRKSTRLNSSHVSISYAVFCLKKKKKNIVTPAPYISTAHIIDA